MSKKIIIIFFAIIGLSAGMYFICDKIEKSKTTYIDSFYVDRIRIVGRHFDSKGEDKFEGIEYEPDLYQDILILNLTNSNKLEEHWELEFYFEKILIDAFNQFPIGSELIISYNRTVYYSGRNKLNFIEILDVRRKN